MTSIKLLVFLCFLFISCNLPLKYGINIIQKNINYPIILQRAKDNKKRIISIQFPKKIILSHSLLSNLTLLRIYYIYNSNISNDQKGGFGIKLFKKRKEKIHRVANKKRVIKSNESLDLIYYSFHFIDSIQSIQLNKFAKKMLSENKDTLHIGTVAEFKSKHGKLFEKLTQNDSISIQFLEGDALGERITVPVNW